MNEDIDFFKEKFNVSRETMEKLKMYQKFLIEKNKTINLIGKNTEKSIFTRHFADSAQIYNLLDKKFDVIDIGSGAGFPGIIVKILMENESTIGNIILIEKNYKKSNFLRDLCIKLDLKVKIENRRLEIYDFLENSTVVSRAFKSTLEIINILYRNIQKIREIVLLKGKTYQQEVDDAKKKYTFELEKFRSITSDESAIIKIRNIKLNTTLSCKCLG
jgi:16S rRNA (guanine527-N7)-methyltransferase